MPEQQTGERPPDGTPEETQDKGIVRAPVSVYAFPARVIQVRDMAELMKKARASATDAEAFENSDPFFWTAEISSSRMDAYNTHMLPSTLRNFRSDLQSGVSFQNSHRTNELGFGRSIDSRFVGGGGNGVSRVEGDFYTVPGLNLNGVSTTDLIRGIQMGLVADNSVGFFGGDWMCDIDGLSLDDPKCGHFPGMRYAVKGKSEPVMASAGIDDAHLAEVSAVYDGATPGAGILKAQRFSEAGLLDPDTARLLESQYRIALPASHHTWAGAALRQSAATAAFEAGFVPAPNKEHPMPELTLDDVRRDLRRALDLNDPTVDPVAHVLETAGRLKEVTAITADRDRLLPLEDEVKRLTPLADMGRQYHVDLLEATLAEGVRAQGNGFPLETQRALLANATLDQLKTLKTAYESQATATLSGGRVSADKGEPDPNEGAAPKKNDWTPKGAFAG